MQNSTLRFKDKSFYLLTLFLIIGSLSSYGQCADVSDDDAGTTGNQQDYCYLSTVQDLLEQGTNDGNDNVAPANIEIYETADSINDTDPLDRNELLTNSTVYYFGDSTDSSCTRVPVEVSVEAQDTPSNSVTGNRGNFTISPCETSGFTAEDLEDLFTADAGYDLEVYDSEFGTTAMLPGDPLVAGDSYFVGQVPLVAGTGCPSTRAAVGFDPIETPGPTAAATQTFCESATVADLQASGTEPNTQAIRWYRSETSNSPLASDVELINGEDYFAAQVVNDRNSPFPPCETPMAERTRVVVEVTPGPEAGDNATGVICEDEVAATFPSFSAVRSFYLDLLAAGVPTNGTFNPTINQIIDAYNNDADGLGDFTTTYTIGSGACTDTVELTASIIENISAEAGDFDDVTDVCTDDAMIDLSSLPNNNADAVAGGTFTGTGVSGNMFDPSVGEGTYTITYTVDETSGDCVDGSSSTTFDIVVNDADAGTDINETVCSSDLENPTALAARFGDYLSDGRDTGGSFSPDLATLYAAYQADVTSESLPQTYVTIYTVNEGSCSDSAEISITVNPSPDAGEDGTANLNSTDAPVDLMDYLGGSPDMGGTWSPGNPDGSFDPSTDPAGTYTYTVTNSFDCSDSAQVTVTIETDPTCTGNEAGNDNIGIVCQSEVDDLFPSVSAVRTYLLNLIDAGVPRTGTFSPNAGQLVENYLSDSDGLGDFTTTYTVTVGDCTDSAQFTISVIPESPAEAGDFDDVSDVCSSDAMIDLTSLPNNDADATNGGTFTGTGVTGNMFDPSVGAGSYTITYTVDDSTPCVTAGTNDSTTFTITVDEGANAGVDIEETLCSSDLENPTALAARFSVYLSDGRDTDGTFSPAPSAVYAQIQADVTAENLPQTYTVTYTVENGSCSDSAEISLTITGASEANAGSFDNIDNVCSGGAMIDLTTLENNDSDAQDNGTFTGTGVSGNMFDPSIGEGTYTITYTVDSSSSCVVDGDSSSTEFTITVATGDANAGADNSMEVCETEVSETFPNSARVRAFYLSMLEDGVATNGTFSPTIAQIINQYQADEDGIGEFSTTYTVTDGGCSDSAVLTISVVPTEDIVIDAIADLDVCLNDDAFDLFALLPDGTLLTGEFDGYDDGMFDPAVMGEGSYNVTYMVSGEDCSYGEASFTISVGESAFAGEGADLSVCTTDDVQNLFDFVDADADMDGTFSLDGNEIENGLMDPSEFDAGTYTVVYTVMATNDCGDSTAEFNITVNAAPSAPEIADSITYCAILMPTGADLMMAGEDLTFYSDAELQNMVTAEEELMEMTYYATQMSDGGCESEAASFTVILSDPGTPTVDPVRDAEEFCSYNDPTIADLSARLVQTSNVTWFATEDSMEPLSTGTPLQDGTTYYASLYDPETDCDSVNRLAYTVDINDDCELIYPEGISPNGDMMNDSFIIEDIELKYPNYTIDIYNRWGDVVYKGNANTDPWNGFANQSGTFGDDVLPVGVYFYRIVFNDGETEPKTGKVYLSR